LTSITTDCFHYKKLLKRVQGGELPAQSFIQNKTGDPKWIPGLDANGDGYFSIHDEWEPLLKQVFAIMTTSDPKSPYYDKWLQSQLALKDTNLELIGNVSASILILNGENDIQTPVQEAYLLEQRLTDVNHVDHTLITYPGLGHSFYPAKGLNQPLGPIQEYVLSDLAAWLKDPDRTVRHLEGEVETSAGTITSLQTQLIQVNTDLQNTQSVASDARTAYAQLASETQRLTLELQASKNETEAVKTKLTGDLERANQEIGGLQGQVKTLQSESSTLQNSVTGLQERNSELQGSVDMATTLAYVAIIIALIAGVCAVVIALRRRSA